MIVDFISWTELTEGKPTECSSLMKPFIIQQQLLWKLDLVSKLMFEVQSCQRNDWTNIQLANLEEKQRGEDDMEV